MSEFVTKPDCRQTHADLDANRREVIGDIWTEIKLVRKAAATRLPILWFYPVLAFTASVIVGITVFLYTTNQNRIQTLDFRYDGVAERLRAIDITLGKNEVLLSQLVKQHEVPVVERRSSAGVKDDDVKNF